MNPVSEVSPLAESTQVIDDSQSDGAVEAASGIEAAACVTCNAPRTGPYCAQCGQRVMEGPHTFRSVLASALARILSVDRGLGHTMKRLTVDPDGVVKDYLGGRTVVYTHPVAYVIISFALFALSFRWSGGVSGDDRVFYLALVFFLAASSRVVFARAGMNYVEHVILNMFLFAHAILPLTGAVLIGVYLPSAFAWSVMAAAFLGAAAYWGWAYARIFAGRPIVSGLGGLVALAGGIGAWSLVVRLVVRSFA